MTSSLACLEALGSTDMPPGPHHPGRCAAWRSNGLIWLTLLGLMAASFIVALMPLGVWPFRINVLISGIAIVLVGLFSMNLDRAPTLDRLAAVAGLLFIVVMFTIAFCDLFTRV